MIANMSANYKDRELQLQIATRLAWLSYPALERLVTFLLRAMDYREVRIVDGGNQRGYSRYGGMSIMARSRGPIHDSLTLVQVKQIAVQRRYVDELRGCMLRWGAAQGIIISPGNIPEKTRFCADMFPGHPIRLISRARLAQLLIDNGLGIRTEPLPIKSPDKLVLDELFFEILSDIQP